MKKDIKRFAKHGGIYMVGNILNRVGAFILLPLYTNFLSIEEYGVLEIFYSVSAVISVFLSAGLSHATLRFYFDYEKESDKKSLITTNFLMAFVFATVGVLVLLIWRDTLMLVMFDSVKYVDAFKFLMMIVVLEMSGEILFAYLRAKEYSIIYVMLTFIKLITQVVLSYYFVRYLSQGVDGVLKSNLISIFVIWLILVIIIIKECGIKISFEKVGPIFKYSLPFLSSVVVGVIAANVDKFILKSSISLEAVGIYALSLKFALVLRMLLSEPFYRSYGSFRFTIMGQSDAADIQAVITKYVIIGGVFVGLGVALFTPAVLEVMSPKNFWPASKAVPLILIAYIISIVTYIYQTGILYEKKSSYIFYISLINLTSVVGFNLLLTPRYGVYGAAISLVISSLITSVITNYVSQRYFLVQYYYYDMFKYLLLGFFLYFLSMILITQSMLWSIILKMVIVSIFVLVAYFSDEKIREFVGSALVKVRGKLGRNK